MLPLNRRILLADDDREVRLGVADLLTGIGLDVLQAEDGWEAIELGRAQRIDGALFDVHMPGVSGIEALTILRREVIELPCIVYSGRWSPELEREVLELGIAACLKKPVDPVRLRDEVRRLLRLTPDRN